jgi:hypothetical protein
MAEYIPVYLNIYLESLESLSWFHNFRTILISRYSIFTATSVEIGDIMLFELNRVISNRLLLREMIQVAEQRAVVVK